MRVSIWWLLVPLSLISLLECVVLFQLEWTPVHFAFLFLFVLAMVLWHFQRRNAGLGFPLVPAPIDRVALSGYRRSLRACAKGDLDGAQKVIDGLPDTPAGRTLGTLVQSGVLFDRGQGAEAVDLLRRWCAAHPPNHPMHRQMVHTHVEASAVLLIQGLADPAYVLPTLRPVLMGVSGVHRRLSGCAIEVALDLYEGRPARALAGAYRMRRWHRTRWLRAECECLIAICSVFQGDRVGAERALDHAVRLFPAHPAIGFARARVTAAP